MFDRDYVELLAVPKPHPATQRFTDFLAKGEGLGAIALASADARSLHAELAGAGIAAEEPLDFSRPVEGAGEARFRIVQLPAEASPGCRVFACEHFTREAVWRPQFLQHAIGATGIAAIAVVAEDPASAALQYGGLLAEKPLPIDEGQLVPTGSAPIVCATRGRLGHRLAGLELPARPRPLVAALFIRVADRARAAAALRRGGLEPVVLKDGSFAVHAGDAHGVALVFG